MTKEVLPFEEPLRELRARIEELRNSSRDSAVLTELLEPMQAQYENYERQLYENLQAWNTVLMARHPDRPQARDFFAKSFDAFEELHGDRVFGDDAAMVTGLANLGRHRVMAIGQHRGRNVEERHRCNAGCPHPEGYRKALRKMKTAEKFGLPVVCLIDTKGAYPGIGSEERGVAVAIAENLREMSVLRTPVVCVVIGEGGSGGALGIGVGDRILMLRHAYYSVISPEGCASILWRDGAMKSKAAEVLKLTSRDLLEFGLIDAIVDEPLGGAHRDPDAMALALRDTLIAELDALASQPIDNLLERRYLKFRSYGRWLEGQSPEPPAAPESARPAAAAVDAEAVSPPQENHGAEKE